MENNQDNIIPFTNEDVKKGEQLIIREPFGGDMLEIVGNDEKGYALVLGRYRITEWQPTINDVKLFIEKRQWDVIIYLIGTMLDTKDLIVVETKENKITTEHSHAFPNEGYDKPNQ